uniref:Cyclin-like domain-containing protein n=1 Tax=Ignisphaera aggregans TaxID=334771 RepID=A0A7C2VNH1_9CREN
MTDTCTNTIMDHERGLLICADTGEVIEENNIIFAHGWRAFDHAEWNKRAHSSAISQTVHDTGLTTDIGVKNVGTTLMSHREYMKMLRLKTLQRKTRVNKQDRKIVEALSRLNHICAVLGLPEPVKETAAVILKKIFYAIHPRRDDLLALSIASVVLAARKHGIPMRVKQLLHDFGVNEDKYWKLISEIHMKADVSEFKSFNDPRSFLSSIVTNLKLSQKALYLASKIVEVLKKNGLAEGKDPAGIAAAVVYLTSIILDEKKTQKEVARASNVTEVTIRNRYRDIVDKVAITVYL